LNTPAQPHDELHTAFLSILPRIQLHGHISFRHSRPDKREEAVAELVALCWKWFIRLAERGKDATLFPTALARFAARAVHNGRRLCGMQKTKDVLSPRAQQINGFTVVSLPEGSSLSGNLFDEALIDNTQTPPPDQVAFRLDFPAWRLTRSDRDRRVIDDLLVGERTSDVADRHGLTAGRVSQLRRDFFEDWVRFHGESPEAARPV